MTLNAEQRKLNRLRFKQHKHEDYTVDIRFSPEFWLFDFEVHKGVFRPEVSSGIKFAKYLAGRPELYKGKKVLDMCCGTGIQGIVMGKNLFGMAREVHFSDISEEAVRNTFDNIVKYSLTHRTRVFHGDLFEYIPIKEKYDLIVCNHPFLPGKPVRGKPISRAWLNPGNLTHKFLHHAKDSLSDGGMIVMPFSDIAGTVNHPGILGEKYGYKVWKSENQQIRYNEGFRSGFRVYHLIR
jgi:methylase of polypeptide subunit release factors